MDMLAILHQIATQYQLEPLDLHGLNHWARVMENGFRLAESEGGDKQVIRLFAIFHDACRQNQSIDHGHGARAADLAEKLLGDLSVINRGQLELLKSACRDHTDGKTQAPISIQICWDADRLDLARVSIIPDPQFLCTATARSKAFRSWANKRARDNYAPQYVIKEWLPLFASTV